MWLQNQQVGHALDASTLPGLCSGTAGPVGMQARAAGVLVPGDSAIWLSAAKSFSSHHVDLRHRLPGLASDLTISSLHVSNTHSPILTRSHNAGGSPTAGRPKRQRKAPDAFQPTFDRDRPLGARQAHAESQSPGSMYAEQTDSDASAEDFHPLPKRQRRGPKAPSRLGKISLDSCGADHSGLCRG